MNDSLTANFSNTTLEVVPRPGFAYYSLGITMFFLTPLLIFNILLTVTIAVEKSIVGTLRLVLVNIITAGQIVNAGLTMAFLSNIIISGCWCPEVRPSDFACRLLVWALTSGGAARVMYMATFGIVVHVLVQYGAEKVKIWVAIVVVVAVWVGVLLPNVAIFSPDVMLINFNEGACAAHGTGYKTYIYVFGYTGVYGLLGFAVSVLSPIATVWFIRHNTIAGDITLIKAMIKFAIFLILGNVINFTGQTASLLFAAFAPAGQDWHELETAFNYVEGIFILLSLIPTPVLVLVYFGPVRQRMICMLCGVCMKNISKLRRKTAKRVTSNANVGINL